MASRIPTGILDLPPLMLSRIAAAVSTAPREPYADIDFYVNCNSEQLLAVIPMSCTCRAFRKAVQEAVAGVEKMIIGYNPEWVQSWRRRIPVFSVDMLLRMPNLISLKELASHKEAKSGSKSSSLTHLLWSARPLRRYHKADYDPCEGGLLTEHARILARIHGPALKDFVVRCYRSNSVKLVFDALSSEVEKVGLVYCYSKEPVPVLSQNALSNLRFMEIQSTLDSSAIVRQVATAPNLTEFLFGNEGRPFPDIMKLADACQLKCITLIGTFPTGIAEALGNNTLDKVQRLEYDISEGSDTRSDGLCTLIAATRCSLRELKLRMFPSVNDIVQLCSITFRVDCEIDFTMDYGQAGTPEEASDLLKPLLNCQNIVSLGLLGLNCVYLVDKLHLLKNLRKVTLDDFYVSKEEGEQFRSNTPPHIIIDSEYS